MKNKKLIASKHPKLVNFINRFILRSHKKRYIKIYNEQTKSWYQAEFHRSRFWHDNEPITFKTILQNYKIWHVWYWDTYDGNGVRCEMWCSYQPLSMVYGSLQQVEPIIKAELIKTMNAWIKLGEGESK